LPDPVEDPLTHRRPFVPAAARLPSRHPGHGNSLCVLSEADYIHPDRPTRRCVSRIPIEQWIGWRDGVKNSNCFGLGRGVTSNFIFQNKITFFFAAFRGVAVRPTDPDW